MKFRVGVVAPALLLVIAPVAAQAQQASAYRFALPTAVVAPHLDLAQDPPSDKPEHVMARSGIFLGLVSMLGGAVAGMAISQETCQESTDDKCRSRYAATGALAASSLAVPLGVTIANDGKRSFLKSLGVSLLTGTALYFGTKAIPGEPVQIAPFLASPLQTFTSVKIEMASRDSK